VLWQLNGKTNCSPPVERFRKETKIRLSSQGGFHVCMENSLKLHGFKSQGGCKMCLYGDFERTATYSGTAWNLEIKVCPLSVQRLF